MQDLSNLSGDQLSVEGHSRLFLSQQCISYILFLYFFFFICVDGLIPLQMTNVDVDEHGYLLIQTSKRLPTPSLDTQLV